MLENLYPKGSNAQWVGELIEHAIDAIISIDTNSRVTLWNPAAERIFGYSADEALSQSLPALIIPERFRELHIRGMEHYLATGEGPLLGHTVEVTAQRKNGSIFPIELSIFKNDDVLTSGFTAIIRDVTIRKHIEEELSQKSEELETLVQLQKLQLTTASQREALTQEIIESIRNEIDLDKIIQLAIDYVGKITDADRCVIWMFDSTTGQFKFPSYEYRRNIKITPISESSNPERMLFPFQLGNEEIIGIPDVSSIKGMTKEDSLGIQERKVTSMLHVPIKYKDTLLAVLRVHTEEKHIWNHETIIMVGNIATQIAIATHHAILLNQAQQYATKLRQSNEDLEHFATVASHDLQAPLRKIKMFCSYLEKSASYKLSAEEKDYLIRLEKSVTKMQGLIDDLLAFSRISRRGKAFLKTDLSILTDEVLQDLQPIIRENDGQVEVNEMVVAEVDPSQMQSLIFNLVENGIKFHRPNVQPIVKVSAFPLDEQYYELVVSDNGIGISDENLEEIFHIFRRLHSEKSYPGTGVGLAICKKIAERHNGTIIATSIVGQGSTFRVKLPFSPANPESMRTYARLEGNRE
jgi:PAS domain S-box-containing protein